MATSVAMVPAHAETVEGTIAFASPDPSVARRLAQSGETFNGLAGYLTRLSTVADAARSYALVSRGGATGVEDFDVWFYKSIDGQGEPCDWIPPTSTDGGGEAGTMCAGARYAVVVLFTGADASFELRY